MEYHYWDLGQLQRGAVVRVSLSGNAANIRLVDHANYRAFQSGQQHRYTGGHATRSPVQLSVPHDDRWFLVVDYGGYAGRGRASVQILQAA